MKSLFLPGAGAVIRYHDLPGAEPAVVLLHGLGAAGRRTWSGRPAGRRSPGAGAW